MSIYKLLADAEIDTAHLVMVHPENDEFFSWYGCDSCNLSAGKSLGMTVNETKLTDTKSGEEFEYQLCAGCRHEFEYPSNDADEFNADENNHITELGV